MGQRLTSFRIRSVLVAAATIPITLFGLVLLTFSIAHLVPIDPVLAVVGDRAPQDVVDRTRHEMGLDLPLPEQFLRYTGQLARGNLGRSVQTGNPVTTDIGRFFPATIELATSALVLAILAGIPLGVLAASRQGRFTDQLIRVLCLGGHSIPVFVLALLSLLIFYATLGWAPGPGRQDVLYQDMVPPITGLLLVDAILAQDWPSLWDAAAHLALPAFVLAAFNAAYIARMTRAFMLEALQSEHILTAMAKGLSPAVILWRHAFGTILVRLVTVVALTYAGLLEGAVLTETVFSWPGLGQYLTGSLLNADMNPVLGATLVVGLTYLALNLLADLIYRLLDPRLR